MLSALSSKNPLGDKLCQKIDCQLCRFQDSKGKCQTRSAVYTSTCVMCEKGGLSVKNWGETSSNAYTRARQHIGDTLRGSKRSHMVKHLELAHPRETVKFQEVLRFEVKSSHRSAFLRQLKECIDMKSSTAVIMNDRDGCSRCVIPNLPMGDRTWIPGEPQRLSAVTNVEPREHVPG